MRNNISDLLETQPKPVENLIEHPSIPTTIVTQKWRKGVTDDGWDVYHRESDGLCAMSALSLSKMLKISKQSCKYIFGNKGKNLQANQILNPYYQGFIDVNLRAKNDIGGQRGSTPTLIPSDLCLAYMAWIASKNRKSAATEVLAMFAMKGIDQWIMSVVGVDSEEIVTHQPTMPVTGHYNDVPEISEQSCPEKISFDDFKDLSPSNAVELKVTLSAKELNFGDFSGRDSLLTIVTYVDPDDLSTQGKLNLNKHCDLTIDKIVSASHERVQHVFGNTPESMPVALLSAANRTTPDEETIEWFRKGINKWCSINGNDSVFTGAKLAINSNRAVRKVYDDDRPRFRAFLDGFMKQGLLESVKTRRSDSHGYRTTDIFWEKCSNLS